MVKPPRLKDRKVQFGLTMAEWDIQLIKALAWKSRRGQQESVRQALFPELIRLAGGDVQSASDLIVE